MTNNITSVTAPPAPNASASHAQSGKKAADGQPTSPFLALLAMLGDAQPTDVATVADSLPLGTKKNTDSAGPAKAMPPSADTTDPLHPGKHSDDKHHKGTPLAPVGVVQGIPVLPMPIIIGIPLPPVIPLDGKGPTPDPTVRGIVTAHPILGAIPDPGVRGIITDPILAGSSGKSPLLAVAIPPTPSTAGANAGEDTLRPVAAGIPSGIVASLAETGGDQSSTHSGIGPLDLPKVAPSSTATPTTTTQGKAAVPPTPSFALPSNNALSATIPSAPLLPLVATAAANGQQATKDAATATTAPVAALAATNSAQPTTDKTRGTRSDFADLSTNVVTSGPGMAQATTITTPATPTHPAVANATHQIVAQAQLLQNGQTAEMRLRLRPPDLGEVNVTVRRDATGGLTVHLVAATSEAASALNANMHFLRASLDQHSHGRGAEVTLGQHDAAGSPPQQGRGHATPGQENDGSLLEETSISINKLSTTQSQPSPSVRNSTVDYDA